MKYGTCFRLGGFTANVMVDYEDMTEINALVDELGMDSEELGGIVAWVMDLYEHGIITKQDLGGIDLQWGSAEAICELIKKIAYKEDRAPSALAEGFRRAYGIFGEASKWYAFEVHGCAAPTYDVRNRHAGFGLQYCTSHNGARMDSGIGCSLEEAATVCIFAFIPFPQIWGSPEEAIRLFLNAALDEAKRKYYVESLKLTEQGLPPGKELERLGLDFVIPILEPMEAIG